MFNKITKQIQFGRDTVTLETGQIARQATAAVMVRIGDQDTHLAERHPANKKNDNINTKKHMYTHIWLH